MGSFTSKHKLTRALKEKDLITIHQFIMKTDISFIKEMDPTYYKKCKKYYLYSDTSRQKEIAKYIFYYLYHTIEYSNEDVIHLSNYFLLEIWKDLNVFDIGYPLNAFIVLTIAKSPTTRGYSILEELSVWKTQPLTVFRCVVNNTNNVELARILYQKLNEEDKEQIPNKYYYSLCDMLADGHFEMFQYVFGELNRSLFTLDEIVYELEGMATYRSDIVLNLFDNCFYQHLFKQAIPLLRKDSSALGFLRSKYQEENRERIQMAKNYITCPHDVIQYVVTPYLHLQI